MELFTAALPKLIKYKALLGQDEKEKNQRIKALAFLLTIGAPI